MPPHFRRPRSWRPLRPDDGGQTGGAFPPRGSGVSSSRTAGPPSQLPAALSDQRSPRLLVSVGACPADDISPTDLPPTPFPAALPQDRPYGISPVALPQGRPSDIPTALPQAPVRASPPPLLPRRLYGRLPHRSSSGARTASLPPLFLRRPYSVSPTALPRRRLYGKPPHPLLAAPASVCRFHGTQVMRAGHRYGRIVGRPRGRGRAGHRGRDRPAHRPAGRGFPTCVRAPQGPEVVSSSPTLPSCRRPARPADSEPAGAVHR